MVWRTMALAAAVALSFAQSQIWNEDFEDDGAGVRYTLSTSMARNSATVRAISSSNSFGCRNRIYVLSGQNTGYLQVKTPTVKLPVEPC